MLTRTIEAVLFAAAKPVSKNKLRRELGVETGVIDSAVEDIKKRHNTESSGVHVIEHEGKLEMVTNPEAGEVVSDFFKRSASDKLTRPQLETLTITAYRGPVTKPEIEHIRGVNCTLILRNLKKRGLINEHEDKEALQPTYTVSQDFLRHIGLHVVSELPQYDEFHDDEDIDNLLEELEAQEEAAE